jgi:drug/metabolite transporter (DMT)-like permease
MMTTFTFAIEGAVAGPGVLAVLHRAVDDRHFLDAVMLGERISRVQGIAIVTGFAGVLIVLKPDTTRHSVGPDRSQCSARHVCYALSNGAREDHRAHDSTQSMMFWMTCMLAIGSTSIALPGWQPVDDEHYPA